MTTARVTKGSRQCIGTIKACFTRNVFCTVFFLTVLKWVECIPTVLFTHNVKKIKGATDKNGLKMLRVNKTLNRWLRVLCFNWFKHTHTHTHTHKSENHDELRPQLRKLLHWSRISPVRGDGWGGRNDPGPTHVGVNVVCSKLDFYQINPKQGLSFGSWWPIRVSDSKLQVIQIKFKWPKSINKIRE